MARFTGATWKPIPTNYTAGGQASVRGVVIHIMDGTYGGTDSWFRNPAAQASSHFGTSRAGQLCQWVDTANRAWAQSGGNRTWLSVENEGRGGDSLTDAQLTRCAEVLAWAHKIHGVPLQLTTDPNGRGLGYHAMGGSAWGGHPSCPGSRVVAQLPEILKRAKKIAGSSSQALEPFPGADFFRKSPNSPIVTAMGRRLVAEGCSAYADGPGPRWTEADRKSYQKWQSKLGYTGADADGWPGATSWAKLRVPNV
ncbi:peptidoglycan-binding protein [Streptomyces sp. NBC_01498]|uniref:peptidoglycan-binding protein n=1 Tax=Streptomyces sp. NBC_01498 TaxID=2975870 RepID=UPI002E7B0ECC|nr:peptidoglycan-binding protein [Streptomyces sp. NBC_01498]WTL25597.1 peptidoglycan-binding protein [Streptomyces sp. NBC_01498]